MIKNLFKKRENYFIYYVFYLHPWLSSFRIRQMYNYFVMSFWKKKIFKWILARVLYILERKYWYFFYCSVYFHTMVTFYKCTRILCYCSVELLLFYMTILTTEGLFLASAQEVFCTDRVLFFWRIYLVFCLIVFISYQTRRTISVESINKLIQSYIN